MNSKPMMPEEYLATNVESLTRVILKMSNELPVKEFDEIWRTTIGKLSRDERKILRFYTHLLLRAVAPEMEC